MLADFMTEDAQEFREIDILCTRIADRWTASPLWRLILSTDVCKYEYPQSHEAEPIRLLP